MRPLREITPLVIEGWRKHKDGYSAFISDLDGHYKSTNKVPRHPVTRKPFSMAGMKAHKDREGDVTHWTTNHEGKKITVWND